MIGLAWRSWRWRFSLRIGLAIVSVVSLAFLFLWHLGSLPAGLSATEQAARNQSASLQHLWSNPINAPHNVLIYIFLKLGLRGLFWLRLTSVLWATIFVFAFFKLCRRWFGEFTAWLSTILFTATPLLLLTARSADASIMYLLPVCLAALYYGLLGRETPSRIQYLTLFGLVGLCLYIPGTFWLIMLGAILARNNLRRLTGYFPKKIRFTGLLVLLAIISPLIVLVWHSPAQLKTLALLPHGLPRFANLAKDEAWAVLGLFWHTNAHHTLQLGRLPLFNAAQLSLATFGVWAMRAKARAKLVGVLILCAVSTILVGLSGAHALNLLTLAGGSIVIAAGLRFLFLEWRSIFPLNPIPQALSVVLMCTLVGISAVYGFRYGLLAWPHTLSTTNAYMLK